MILTFYSFSANSCPGPDPFNDVIHPVSSLHPRIFFILSSSENPLSYRNPRVGGIWLRFQPRLHFLSLCSLGYLFMWWYFKHHLYAKKPHIQISHIQSVMKSYLLQLFNLFDYSFFSIPTDTVLNHFSFITKVIL